MFIYINARFLTQPITGVQRYAIELVKALDTLIDKGLINKKRYNFILVAPHNIIHQLNLKNIPIKCIGLLKGHYWEQVELPFYARQGLLINLCNVGPIFKIKQVVTIHDAAVFANPDTFSLIFRSWYKLLLFLLCRTARKIITVSNYSKEELVKYCSVNPNKIRVVYEGKEQISNIDADQTILQKHNLNKDGYILAVSSLNPNKNFNSIIEALAFLNNISNEVVIAGGVNPKVFGNTQLVKNEKVKYLGYINDSQLKALYENALCFIYPSFYEGFGLPPLEAMACGCPVIVSNVTSLPEVCGDAALYCNPHEPRDIADKIMQLIDDKELLETYKANGLARSRHFTWEKCALEIFNLIKDLINNKGR